MNHTETVDALVGYCQEELGKPSTWVTPPGYPDSLALCVIDAIYSTGGRYAQVINVIDRYTERQGADHGAEELLGSIRTVGAAAWAADVVENRRRAHTKPGAPLKAEVIEQAAELLIAQDIRTVPELRTRLGDSPEDHSLHAEWKKLPSQSSGVTYNYLLILAGLPSVKPDRMVLRFLEDALQQHRISNEEAVGLIKAAATKLGTDARTLDHMIWRAASKRSFTA